MSKYLILPLIFCSLLFGQFSDRPFKSVPLIIKKGKDEILISPYDKIKILDKDSNIVIGTYLSKSTIKKQIMVRGIKNKSLFPPNKHKVMIKHIGQISKGSGNKSFQHAGKYFALVGVPLTLMMHSSEGWGIYAWYTLRLIGTPLFTVYGLIEGAITPDKFEESIILNDNEWKIIL